MRKYDQRRETYPISSKSIPSTKPQPTANKRLKQPADRILEELAEIREILEECCEERHEQSGRDQEKEIKQKVTRNHTGAPSRYL